MEATVAPLRASIGRTKETPALWLEKRIRVYYSSLYDYGARQKDVGKQYCGRIIAIVQSSGTGKSRAVWELHPVLAGVPGVLHGFPPLDLPIREYFVHCDPYRPDLAVIALFASWLKQAAASADTSATDMSDVFATWEHSCYSAEDRRLEPSAKRQEAIRAVAAGARKMAQRYRDAHASEALTSDIDEAARMVKVLIRPELDALAEQLLSTPAVKASLKKFKMERPLVLLAVDGCTPLEKIDEQKELKLVHLRRCVQLIGEKLASAKVALWLLMLDTSSSISGMIPSSRTEKSDREATMLALPPCLLRGHDTFVQTPQTVSRPRDALQLDALKRYGRPLWDGCESEQHGNASWALAGDSVDRHMRYVTNLDAGKIVTAAPSEPLLALAAWVALTSDETDHEALWRYSEVLSTLAKSLALDSAIALKGVEGEFAVPLLLTMARDACDELTQARKTFAEQHESDGKLEHVPAISLASFLPTLLGPACGHAALAQLEQLIDFRCQRRGATERNSGADKNMDDDSRQEAFETAGSVQMDPSGEQSGGSAAWLNFTHMARLASKAYAFGPRLLWYCWKRGLALQCHESQPGIDGVIPVYLGSLEDALDDEDQAAGQMSYIAWRAKDKASPFSGTDCLHGPRIVPLSATDARQGARDDADARAPLFTMLFDLGTGVAFKRAESISSHVKVMESTTCSATDCMQGNAPIVSLRIRGCDAAVFPFLGQFQAAEQVASLVKKPQMAGDGAEVEEPTFHDGCGLVYDEDGGAALAVSEEGDGPDGWEE
ncbi:uncharacterized protein PSFLO_06594 [Pseudozyma flocculosa]|uniref:Uncharacterized protein n=1 Tax=Pseudozyma flocculosa TaxID=84751 RepID=A0A5C3F9L3_9BASI|nr:uncharacterized protein PSFLO_06594 [Pseudozyma flocculosa]